MFRSFFGSSSNTSSSSSRGSSSGSWVSTDEMAERVRLSMMDIIHSTLLDPYHNQMIMAHLSTVHADGRRSKVLDVGTGTGNWALSIANSQPFCDVTALDVNWSTFSNGTSRHGNIDFATVDIRRPLPWPANSFDVVYVKALLLEVPHYANLVERLAVALRPGGLLVLIEAEPGFQLADNGETSKELRVWDTCVRESYAARGVDVTLPCRMHSHLTSSGVFLPVAYTQEVVIPTGGYMKGSARTLAKAGRLHPSVISATLGSMSPTVLAHGYPEGQVQEVLQGAIDELCSANSRHFQRLYAVYAHKVC